ncbi:uncharacterized protein N7473_007153 [Penicillium subrubescens]|uniref:uncharacterized protein n=1 Tax=Penicillium subrubescens TaxID=1316194 RepID=UPI0025454BC9|nr:uncharacterized protein N7473_007153 [Penicillium subrubescens]KAJ5890925.1 hypothetical protein N7473_007153 [Penicillium subrubescens]
MWEPQALHGEGDVFSSGGKGHVDKRHTIIVVIGTYRETVRIHPSARIRPAAQPHPEERLRGVVRLPDQ